MGKQLQFREDGTFKILQLTDLHFGGDVANEKDQKTLALIDHMIEKEQPDLIAYTGDLIWSEGIERPDQSFRTVLNTGAKWNIPFAVIYGNHDTEGTMTRSEMQNILSEYPLSLSEAGPEDINGVGNYILTVQSGKNDSDEALLYFFDSGALAPEEIGGYEWIHQNQVNWYATESKRLIEKNEKVLPALAFFHIPVPEYDAVWRYGQVSGTKAENVSAPKINSGLFTAMLENKDVMATFAGHDHDNDYCGELAGISLCFGRVSGYNTYGDLQRGARIIELVEGERKFKSWIRLDNDEVILSYSKK